MQHVGGMLLPGTRSGILRIRGAARPRRRAASSVRAEGVRPGSLSVTTCEALRATGKFLSRTTHISRRVIQSWSKYGT